LLEMESLGAQTRKDALGSLSRAEQVQVLDLMNTLKSNLLAAEEKADDNSEVKKS